VRNMERKVRKIMTKEEDKVELEECLWGKLRKNGYKNVKTRKRKTRSRGKKEMKEEYMD
jgi:hypothetical protein